MPKEVSVQEKKKFIMLLKTLIKEFSLRLFAKIVPDYLSNSKDHCIVMHADGAGTKSSLAYAYWKETGDISVLEGNCSRCIDHEYR